MRDSVYEIGSEFWAPDVSDPSSVFFPENTRFLLTGRTALDHIIKDVLSYQPITRVCVPSYCCHTMLKPFIDNHIKISFYDVYLNYGKYEYNFCQVQNCELVLVMQYFGFVDPKFDAQVCEIKSKGKIIIDDATHSWFSRFPYSKYADYTYVSFRKWTGLAAGAVAVKNANHFIIAPPYNISNNYINFRTLAACLKKEYIINGKGDKNTFLTKFNKAEELIEDDYADYTLPNHLIKNLKSINAQQIKKQRKINADYLVSKLTKLNDEIIIAQPTNNDVPLFLPIEVYPNQRDSLRQHLIQNEIYCPVHWPLTEYHKPIDSSLYDKTLSLVCDQRYNIKHMQRIIDAVFRFFNLK